MVLNVSLVVGLPEHSIYIDPYYNVARATRRGAVEVGDPFSHLGPAFGSQLFVAGSR